jgi:hypothetical protein
MPKIEPKGEWERVDSAHSNNRVTSEHADLMEAFKLEGEASILVWNNLDDYVEDAYTKIGYHIKSEYEYAIELFITDDFSGLKDGKASEDWSTIVETAEEYMENS